ncbi:hypothetical protein [Desulfobacula toluolica]|uniref:Conserved uncharacterized protein n=1 Tax=Desulfobacula toluolica (strain DSM 7467 / Tol2) TaxID=651182 RepID=K0NGZ4_DESTT|nr:hypothetical protein [Desulfobacula toluolica]CCK80235.1 conserved uncharacterized protein [Desulfobacula toluolica Tol2]
MKPATSSTTDSALEEVRQQFSEWRRTKIGRERIPEFLWQSAIGLFNTGGYSLHKISKTLRLNHTDLKKHVNKNLAVPQEKTPAFIDLEPPVSDSECVIEMENISGSKMRMCFRGKPDPNLIELGKSFWRKPA